MPILGAALALVVIGILSIYSAGITAEGAQASNEYIKQIIWASSGLVFMGLAFLVDYKRIKDYSFFVYAFLMILLVYTRLFGRVVNGARSWIGIGEAGIQPSEFMKLAT
ncbi:MAG: FtsW/RodA/SpoVE family cell cycle protein, partial [Spirochaetaceae bacterium]|nr:FtsW/RodA/SpoVE family cell cycle protein [Spirochaetaceae bacterium]